MIKVLVSLVLSFNLQALTPQFVPLADGEKKSDHESYAKNYMIASQGPHATKAGKKMYKLGGNIIDAFVAMSFAISVERPQSTGLGGGGFMLYLPPKAKSPIVFDFREVAPLQSNSKMYLDKNGVVIKKKSLNGVFAIGVPGLVAGLLMAHREYGKLPIKTVMGPAINLAENGFIIYPELEKAIMIRKNILKNYIDSKKIFLNSKSQARKAGEVLIQKDLAQTLRLISNDKMGTSFYQGITAQKIVKHIKKLGGLITLFDLINYRVKKRRAISGKFKGYDIFSMGPPSSGGVHIIQILNMIENFPLEKWGPHHHKSIHVLSMSMQQAFADRAKYLGDPDFVNVPTQTLTSKSYARKQSTLFSLNRYRSAEKVFPGKINISEPDHTTHLSLADKSGAVVVSTQTINGYFGSGVVAKGTGVVLNNEMDDFSAKAGASNLFGAIGGKNNLVAPNKRPLSSMSPTIVMKDNKPVLALGSPSGTRILTCVTQSILNYLVFKLDLYKSLSLTRIHHQWQPDYLRIGKFGIPKETEKKLLEMGYKLQYKNLGCRVQAIAYENKLLHGVSDIRGAGFAYGQ